ncbi:MAG: hypothetical protein RMJ66_06790, partial [Bacteroidia bacterium]|nr:hypothetical protein [Bacteroidia bacterium]MDW8134759.1 hypothetical protein [Bacteroidia bacterium]
MSLWSWILWGQILIRGAWLHRGDGSLCVQADVLIQGDSIAAIGPVLSALPHFQVIEARGMHLYPALISLGTPVGLIEIEAVRATRDHIEVGDFTPEVEAYTAFNVDSKILSTLIAVGIVYVESTPQGGLIAGQSALMKVVGRTKEEAVVLPIAALHLYPPTQRPNPYAPYEEQKKQAEKAKAAWNKIDSYLQKAARWCAGDSGEQNISFRALCPYLSRKAPVVWHVDNAEDIESAIRLSQKWGLRSAIAGGAEATRVLPLLKESSMPIILQRTHRLPHTEDAPIAESFMLPKILRDSGITVILSHESFWNQRNLPYNAGTAVAYGVPAEEALAMITREPARWLGLTRLGQIAQGYQ